MLETAQLPIWHDDEELGENPHELASELYNIWDKIDPSRVYEDWHDALQIREEALERFSPDSWTSAPGHRSRNCSGVWPATCAT